MKELSIEEKAKRYDEAIERARALIAGETETSAPVFYVDNIKDIFPELKESKDEKIRKVIRSWIYTRPASFFDNGISKEEILDWLERQGEHLENFDEAEKEKSDFVGDGFIKCFANFLDFKEGETYWLEYMGDDKYNVRSDNLLGKTYHITPCQLYTVFKKLTWLEKQGEQKPTDKIEPKFKVGDWVVHDMSDGRKVIRQIVNMTNKSYVLNGEDFNTFYFNDLENDYHLWTIKDAKDGDVLYTSSTASNEIFIFRGLTIEGNIECYSSYDSEDKYCEGKYHFIGKPNFMTHPADKEQRDLLFQKMKEAGYVWDAEKKEVKKIEENFFWSEEDEQYVKDTLALLAFSASIHTISQVQNWLKSLKDRVQPKQEWSEEDEQYVKDTLALLAFGASIHTISQVQNWLKSLRHKKHWKPSDEQMEALESATENCAYSEYQDCLRELIAQLKKLKGE